MMKKRSCRSRNRRRVYDRNPLRDHEQDDEFRTFGVGGTRPDGRAGERGELDHDVNIDQVGHAEAERLPGEIDEKKMIVLTPSS